MPSIPVLATEILAAAQGLFGDQFFLPVPASEPAPAAEPAPASPSYSIKVGDVGPWKHPIDTPAFSFIDKDGSYWFQQSEAEYEIDASRVWEFYSGENIDTATLHNVTFAHDPANPADTNGNTTWRCNNKSPTGREATYPPVLDPNRYNQANYCDLMGLWVDPDTGDWYGLIHNEFTPAPYGDRLHFDAIDLAVSTDQGATWNIRQHVLTSPYPTIRGDESVFTQDTYYWGAGDQRLHVDLASGYFYVWYGSRVIDKNGTWVLFYTHAARAPIVDKMRAGSWKKWYDGRWEEEGLGGRESSLVPTSWEASGHVPADKEYNPSTPGKAAEQAAAGNAPKTTPLFWMDVSYNAYLGLYIGQPNNLDRSGHSPQEFYATDDLTTQKWTLIGDTGDYRTASEYRWLIDGVSRTSQSILGKDFRSYCSFGCSNGSISEYVNLAIESSSPAAPVDTSKAYTITSATHRALSTTKDGKATSTSDKGAVWKFEATGDGAYTITDEQSGKRLGVADTPEQRAWGTVPALSGGKDSKPSVGQQWWVIPGRSPTTNRATGAVRIVNRYSGLPLALSDVQDRLAETTPGRFWNASPEGAAAGRKRAEQELILAAV